MRFLALALALVAVATSATAAPLTPTEIVNRHTGSGGNVDAIMADYADDAVVLQNGKAVQGKEAIRKLFTAMFGPRPKPAEGAPAGNRPPAPAMKVTKVWEEGKVGFMTWESGPVHATEEFIVRDGKIAVQAIFMSASPAPPTPK